MPEPSASQSYESESETLLFAGPGMPESALALARMSYEEASPSSRFSVWLLGAQRSLVVERLAETGAARACALLRLIFLASNPLSLGLASALAPWLASSWPASWPGPHGHGSLFAYCSRPFWARSNGAFFSPAGPAPAPGAGWRGVGFPGPNKLTSSPAKRVLSTAS